MSDVQSTQSNQPDVAGVAFQPPLMLLALIVVGLLAWWFSPLSFLPAILSIVLGPLVTLIAIGLFLWATGIMTRGDTAIPPDEPTTAIMIEGPFKFTRNPIYLAMLLLLIGLGFWLNSLWFLILAAAFVILIQWGVISREEAYLTQKFGDEYLDYKRQVRRWL